MWDSSKIMAPLYELYLKDYEEFKKTGYIDSYYGGFFFKGEEAIRQHASDLIVLLELDEEIDTIKLQVALDKTVIHYPYLNFRIEVLDEQPKIRYIEKKDKLQVQKYPFKEISGKTDLGCSRIGYNENCICISIPHIVTDFSGVQQVVGCLLEYYNDGKINQPVLIKKVMFVADLMKYELPLTIGKADLMLPEPVIRLKKNKDIFDVPELKQDRVDIAYHLQLDKNSLNDFFEKNNLSRQVGVSLLIAMAIQKAHPENQKTIRVRGAVNTRKIFGIDDSFQNASVPHVYLDIEPDSLDAGRLHEQAARLKDELKKQLDYDYIADFTNRCGECVRTGDSELRKNILMDYISKTGIFANYISGVISESVGAHVKSINMLNVHNFPILMYVMEVGDRCSLSLFQQFETDIYINAIKGILKENDIVVQ